MNLRIAITLCRALLLATALAGLCASEALAQLRPASPPIPGGHPPPPSPAPADKRTPPVPSAGDETIADAPDIKPFETGIDYKPTSPRTRVTFNLEDADLPDLVRLISQITGRRFIMPSKSRSIKATVYAPTKVTAAEAYQAFVSILELNGLALVPSGSYIKIVESGHIEGRPIPLVRGDGIPSGDRFVTRLHRVDHISAEDAAKLLERFKSGDGSLTAYAPTNMLIITDTGTNMRRMIRILNEIDVARTGEQIWVEPIHHADATEVAARLEEIFETSTTSSGKPTKPSPKPAKARKRKGAAPPPAGATTVGSSPGGGEARISKILADERTNSLIIVSTESAYLRVIEMLKYLDVPMEGEGRIHVHHLQHSDSEEIASTLSSLISGSGAKAKGGKAAATQGPATVFEGKVAVTAHKAANALVITSSPHDYAALRHVIDLLDTERRQVFIEAVIMELSVNRGNSLSIGFHGGIPDTPVDGGLFGMGFEAKHSIGGLVGGVASGEFLSGLAVGVQGPNLAGLSLPAFGIAVNALASNNDANVLSTPHLIATDNVEAEISVGQNVPLQTSVGFGGGLGGSGLAGLAGALGGSNQSSSAGGLGALAGLGGLGGLGGMGFGSVPRQDVGTTVTITPHINDTDEIRLEIKEEISDAGAPSSTGNLGVVSINRTRARTEVVVRDQHTVVIGGLMRDGTTNTVTKVPILGDIPLLGALFRSTKNSKTKRNLLLFLTPYIIRSPADLRSIYERKMRERQEFVDRYFVFSTTEYEPPLDYSRTRGLVGEILMELDELAELRRLAEEAAAQPVPIHEPQPPVGEATSSEDDSSGDDTGDDSGDDGSTVIEPTSAPDAQPPSPEPPASDE